MSGRVSPPQPADEFYVGYLPAPPGLAFYIRMLMPTVLWLGVGAAAVLSTSQTDPGDGIWETGQVRTYRGIIQAAPYPMLRLAADSGETRTLLLVEVGKFGGGKRAAPFDGQAVEISGWLIERDGRRMIELEPGERAIFPLSGLPGRPAISSFAPKALGRATLRGEIVDSKCFLGVMKPGEGKTHKECATLCIAGGIPPMLVTRDAAGTPSYYLLTGPDGKALDERLLPFVADPVKITGTIEQDGDLRLFRINPADIRRL